MQYFLYLEQDDQYHDYYSTTWHNRIISLGAKNLKQAKEEVNKIFNDEYFVYGQQNYGISYAQILKSEADVMPTLGKSLDRKKRKKAADDEARQLVQKRAEFKRLKKKFEGK